MKTSANQKRMSTGTVVLGAILTALVIVLQMVGQSIHLGPFAISLVLAPIVVGAATCGKGISTWLGFVFGVVVLMLDAAAFLAVSIPGTILTVLLKGMACGFAAGAVYKALEKKNRFVAVAVSAVVCPIVNTGIFVIGCLLFFMDAISQWGLAEGYENAFEYLFLFMIGANFLVEMAVNIILTPVIVRVLNIRKKVN
ncbi:MAG: ECF transporter S component [Clostridia bacterium]|nr:ECF transporter S component [Clostridia bacterium]